MASRHAWHTLDTEQICAMLETNAVKGLSRKQATARAKKLNIRRPEALQPLFLPPARPLYRDLGKMLFDPVLLLTLCIALISFLVDDLRPLGGIIIAILLFNAICCAIAKAKAHKVWSKLQLYSNPMIKVIRGGKLYTTDARNVLPGDVVILQEGDICPADIRLDRGSSVLVSQYVLSTKGNREFAQVQVQKSGDTLYLPDREIFNPDCENIVYAGSVIKQGFARGIAVETGRHTYIGAANGTVPGTDRITEPDSISFIRRYTVRFATAQAILLIPLTILLTVTMRYSLSFAECFMTALALCCTAIVEHIVSLADMIRATGVQTASSEKQSASVAIVKDDKASDKLCEMTDLLLLDTAAISDGKYHLESVYACGSIYNKDELHNQSVQKLATELHLYRSAARPPEAGEHDAIDAGLAAPIDALIKHTGVDIAAIELIKSESSISYTTDACTVCNTTKFGKHDVLLSSNERLLEKCTHVATSEQDKILDDSEHIALRTLCRIYRESGYRILLIAGRESEKVTLVGVLAFSQRVGNGFKQCCEQLISGGVRISAFLPNNTENIKILTECELIRNWESDVLTAESAKDQELDLHVAYGSYRAYLGFTKSQIAELIEKLKQRGNVVATYCVDNQMQDLQNMADLSITCDALEYRSPQVAQSLYDKMPVDGKHFSSRASQHTRRCSDVILRRACDQGGGLHGLLAGRSFAFSVNHNLANAMTYLITVQFFRAVLLVVPAMFGTHMLSAASLLISGLILDLAAVLLLAFARPTQSAVSTSYPIIRRLEKPIAYNVANVISACVSALLVWLVFAVLQVLGFVEASESIGLGFTSLYLLQGIVFGITLYEYAFHKQKKNSYVWLGVIAAYGMLFAACLFLPGLNALTGGNTLTLLAALIAPLASIVYFAMYRFLSARGLNLHK